ncbi:MAG: HAD-superfamily hydrolase [Clostridia bacterium]|nr:HAD-superfamily hydrolase [Clostridia bacterium]
MGKFSGYLLVSDLDGTLFGEGHIIPENNIKAIKYFIENGGYFTVATGRGIVACKMLIKNLSKNAPGILFNGAVLYDFDKEEIIKGTGITSENGKSLLKDINKAFPEIPTVVFYKDRMFNTIINEELKNLREIIKMKDEYMPVDSIPMPWFKALCEGPTNELLKLSEFIKTLPYTEFDYIFSSDRLFEILQKGVSKATALIELADYLGIDMKNTIAIGDYYNDLELLKAANYSVVPMNAPSDIKLLADKVVCDHKKGSVADLIENLEDIIK